MGVTICVEMYVNMCVLTCVLPCCFNVCVEMLVSINFENVFTEDEEKLKLQVVNSRIPRLEDGSYHPQDLMAHKLREHLEQENRKALTFLK